MITFLSSLVILIAGYFIYGKIIEKVIPPNNSAVTPCISKQDGIDYLPLPTWKMYMIQFLNIAGLGPIFGAIMGAKFGNAAYLWIVFGCIFAGAVHDYCGGMLSLKNGGESQPQTIGRYLGNGVKGFMGIVTLFLLVLVGVVFISGPAALLSGMTPEYMNVYFWIAVIFIYYLLASMLPIDKIIGKLYPLFAGALIFMAVGILIMLIWYHPNLPEITDGFANHSPQGYPIFPMMFISIACGAVSGFHATQSPMMARCMVTEKQARPVFYGAMITEGVVALIWAAAANWYFGNNGMEEGNAAVVVDNITKELLGSVGAILALLGVIAAPITTGDTALRSARLIIADYLKLEQKSIGKRLLICIPLFAVTIGLLIFSFTNKEGFNIMWRYMSFGTQFLSVFTLWAATAYLLQKQGKYMFTLIPALFMTLVTSTYICIAPEGFQMSPIYAYSTGAIITFATLLCFIYKSVKLNNIAKKADSFAETK